MVLAYLKYKKDGHHAQFFNKLRDNGKHPKQCMVAVARKLVVKAYYVLLKCHEPKDLNSNY